MSGKTGKRDERFSTQWYIPKIMLEVWHFCFWNCYTKYKNACIQRNTAENILLVSKNMGGTDGIMAGETTKKIEFEPEEKQKIFDEIAKHFYNKNFGKMTKSDFEVLMFHFYMDKMIKQNMDENDVLRYNQCSDYIIGRELGITQQRVANLKVKSQLLYPIDFDWKKSFKSLIDHIRFDRNSQKVIIPIPDPNLYYEIQNYLENEGGYIEKTLNTKLLKLRVEYYIELLMKVYGDAQTKRQLISEVKKQLKKENKLESKFDDRQIGKTLLETGVNITSIVANLSSVFPGSVLRGAFSALKAWML